MRSVAVIGTGASAQSVRIPTALGLLASRSPSSRRVSLAEPDLILLEPAGRRLTAARLLEFPASPKVGASWGAWPVL